MNNEASSSNGTQEQNEPSNPYAFDCECAHAAPMKRVWRNPETADKYVDVFFTRLGIDSKNPGDKQVREDLRNPLREFVCDNHLAIEYYEDKLKEEMGRQRNFRWGSIALLGAIPVAIALAPFAMELVSKVFPSIRSADDSLHVAQATALITAVVTALIGLQKSVGTWMNQRQLVGIFWKASADLKENVYTFERTWKGKVLKDNAPEKVVSKDEANESRVPDPKFLADLAAACARARKILREERDAYSATYRTTVIDVGSVLDTARTQATSLWGAFAAETVKQNLNRVEQAETLRANTAERQAKVQRLTDEITNIRGLLSNTSDDEDNKSARETYRGRLVELQLQLATAQATV